MFVYHTVVVSMSSYFIYKKSSHLAYVYKNVDANVWRYFLPPNFAQTYDVFIRHVKKSAFTLRYCCKRLICFLCAIISLC